MTRARVLLADDHDCVLEAVRRILELEFEVVGAVTSGEALLEAAAALEPDLLVVDVSMPGLSGLEAVRRLRESGSVTTRVVFLSVHDSPAIVRQAFGGGGQGYVLKPCADTELVLAVRRVLAGHSYVSPAISL